MRNLEKLRFIKNVSSSWFSLVVNVAVGILVYPIIVHRLGDTASGIWSLAFATTGYYGLFELGIRSSIIRYVSKYNATDDRENLARLMNTSLCAYLFVALLCMVVTLAISFGATHSFKIAPEFRSTAPWLFLMVGTSVALGFPLGLFG